MRKDMAQILAQLLEHIEGVEEIVDMRDGNGWTALHIVTANQSDWPGVRGSMTRQLVEMKADMEARRSKLETTCLLGAAGTKSWESARTLVQLGADVNATNKDGEGLIRMARSNHEFKLWLTDFAAQAENQKGLGKGVGGGRCRPLREDSESHGTTEERHKRFERPSDYRAWKSYSKEMESGRPAAAPEPEGEYERGVYKRTYERELKVMRTRKAESLARTDARMMAEVEEDEKEDNSAQSQDQFATEFFADNSDSEASSDGRDERLGLRRGGGSSSSLACLQLVFTLPKKRSENHLPSPALPLLPPPFYPSAPNRLIIVKVIEARVARLIRVGVDVDVAGGIVAGGRPVVFLDVFGAKPVPFCKRGSGAKPV
jgi:hypothetical protein